MVKSGILVIVQIWVRWTLPRLRIDQVMTTCLKYLVPISCFLFLGATVWPFLLLKTVGRTTLGTEPVGARVARVDDPLGTDPVGTRRSVAKPSAQEGGE